MQLLLKNCLNLQIGFMPHIDNLPSDIYKLLEGKSIADPNVLSKFGKQLGEVFEKRFSADLEKRQPTLRMSNIGKPCIRQLWYELNNYEGEKPDGKAIYKFAFGDIIEALTLVLAEGAGYEVKDYQKEISINEIKGHIDAVISGVLVDVKSASPYSFNKFKDGSLLEEGQDPFGYVGQLAGYSHALNLPAAWIAINKVSGEICILHLPKDRAESYDIQSRINTVRKAISSSDVPDRCYEDEPDGKSGNRKLAVGCSYCSFKQECWRDSNDGGGLKTYIYSTGPRFLTKVVREPNVFQSKESN